MYTIKNIKKSFLSFVSQSFSEVSTKIYEKNLSDYPKWIKERMDSLTSAVKWSKELPKEIQKLNLKPEQLQKLQKYSDNLKTKEDKEKFNNIMKKNPKLIKWLLDIYDNMSSVILQEKYDEKINTLKEKYKDNQEVLDKINKYEKRLNWDLKKFREQDKDYSQIFEWLLETKKPEEFLDNKIREAELKKEEIGQLEIALNTTESKEEQDKRYAWLKEEYEKVQKVKEFKDIIWDKNFEKITAWDFHECWKQILIKLEVYYCLLKVGNQY